MRKLFTYMFIGALFLACVFNDRIIPENISYQLAGSVKRNISKEKHELLEDMKAVLQSGMISIEIYSQDGELIKTAEEPEDISDDFAIVFASSDLTIKTLPRRRVETLILD